VVTLSGEQGSLSIVGAVSPPGGDLSDPVVQATLREVRVFWGLDAKLAYARHFPSINWLNSYSLYADSLNAWSDREVSPARLVDRATALRLLQEEAELEEIVRLVGVDSLSPKDRLTLETARSVREDFLQQDAFHEVDTYSSPAKQFEMLHAILLAHALALKAVEAGTPLEALLEAPYKERIARMKYLPEDEMGALRSVHDEIRAAFAGLQGVRA